MVSRVRAWSTEAEQNSSRTRPISSALKLIRPVSRSSTKACSDLFRPLHEQVIQVALEVGGHLDIHGGRDGLHHAAEGIVTLVDEAGQDVVLVGRQQQFLNRQPHALGDVAGKDVAEIAGRHRKTDRLTVRNP